MSVGVDGNARIWEFDKCSWQLLQSFNLSAPPQVPLSRTIPSLSLSLTPILQTNVCISGGMIYWDSREEAGEVVKACPIGFERSEGVSLVVGVETSLLKAHRVLSVFGTGVGLAVFLVQRAATSCILVCSSDRRGSLAMSEVATPWTLSSLSSLSSLSTSERRYHPLEAETIEDDVQVKLFAKMRNSDLIVLEWSRASAWRIFVFAGKSKLLCRISERARELECEDFQPTSCFALLLTSRSFEGLVEAFDIRSGALVFKVELPAAPSSHFSPCPFNPLLVFVVCVGVGVLLVPLTQTHTSSTDVGSEMIKACGEVSKGDMPTAQLPTLLAPALVALYPEQSPLPIPPSLLAQRLNARTGPKHETLINKTVALSGTASACRAVLASHQRPKGLKGHSSEDVLGEQLLEGVVDFLRQTANHNSFAPDFLLALGSDRSAGGYHNFEITCRLLYEKHPELLGVYVKTAAEAHVGLSFPHRALKAIPPTALTTPQLVARATVLCMCDECNAALALLSASWETTLEFLDALASEGAHNMFEELLVKCVESSDQGRVMELLARRPHMTQEQIAGTIARLCSMSSKDLPPPCMLKTALIQLTELQR